MSRLEHAPATAGWGDAEILRAGRIGGFDPEELAALFGTPLYVYDLEVVERQVAALRAVLPPSFDLAYAVKANPSLGVVAHLGRMGLGADVASAGELETVLRAGIQPSRVVFTGPGKRDVELARAVEAGLGAVTVESPGELGRLEAAASAAGRRVPILLRAAATADRRLEQVRLVGDDGAGKFGMGPDDLAAGARRAVESAHLELLGLHAFGASNVLDAAALADHVEQTVQAARALAVATGFPLRLVDAGGGLGIAYEEDQKPLDLAEFGHRLTALARSGARDPVTRDARILLEPGRFLVGPAGAYVARVVDRKSLDGRDVVILDGGIHHLLRPALVRQQHRVRALGQAAADTIAATAADAAPVTIAGPLCSGLDVLSTDSMERAPAVGELVAVLDVGAYGFTESMPLFLSHPMPAEVAVRRGRAQLLRPRLDPTTWLDTQANADWI